VEQVRAARIDSVHSPADVLKRLAPALGSAQHVGLRCDGLQCRPGGVEVSSRIVQLQERDGHETRYGSGNDERGANDNPSPAHAALQLLRTLLGAAETST
jgi:hypothetical protein